VPLEHDAAYQCPYCGETNYVGIDGNARSQRFIEDCPVCCNPIAFVVRVDRAGEILVESAQRAD
jgi:hypothetical protein